MKKNICIIGASSGVGKALAEYYSSEGNTVFTPRRAKYNLSNYEEIQKLSDTISEEKYDLVIFSAGVGYYKCFTELSDSELQEQISVNTLAPLKILRKNLSIFQQNNTKFVYLSSIMRHIPAKNMSVYASMKQATSQTLKTLRLENKNLSIVNIDLGAIQTPMHLKAGMQKTVGKKVSEILPKLIKTLETQEGSIMLLWQWKILVYFVFPVLKFSLACKMFHRNISTNNK
ncbi:SDR family NAD(P)-dependent oxidoreductase [Candidatus Gracilibacteria bacterium]|nr:SDR family NAD(P)-dependent oxidoreductase [Candidatus Gracilibacteria bacterium]